MSRLDTASYKWQKPLLAVVNTVLPSGLNDPWDNTERRGISGARRRPSRQSQSCTKWCSRMVNSRFPSELNCDRITAPSCCRLGPARFPVAANLTAVTVGPSLGPPINGVCTDVITTLAFDGAFDGVFVSSIAANGQSLTVYPYGPDKIVGNTDDVNISDAPDVAGDNVRVGDLLAVVKGSASALVAVTAVAGNTITFNPGDALGINQFDTTRVMAGTTNRVKFLAPSDPDAPTVTGGIVRILAGQSTVSRVRMVTYWVDTTTTPASPRLMRQIGSAAPNAVAFELEAFALSYDIANGVNNRAIVRMVDADLTTAGACAPLVCSPNQIRKVNATLAIRSDKKMSTGGYYHNTLFTQVALRNLAFVDRYE